MKKSLHLISKVCWEKANEEILIRYVEMLLGILVFDADGKVISYESHNLRIFIRILMKYIIFPEEIQKSWDIQYGII
jgi:hypothetical protein